MKQLFTALQLFRFAQPIGMTAVTLHEKLLQSKFSPAGQLEWESMGWIPPFDGMDTLTLPIGNTIFIAARKQTKMLPASVINDFVRERVEAIESAEYRKVGKREKKEIKDEVIKELLPRALPRNTNTVAYIDIKNNLLAVNTSSRDKAEDIVSLLRNDLGDLRASPAGLNAAPGLFLTKWLTTRVLPLGFQLGADCRLIYDTESVTCAQLDLLSDDIHSLVKRYKEVKYLELIWRDRLSFVLDAGFGIRRIKFLDTEEGDSSDGGDLWSDLFLMTAAFNEFIPELLDTTTPKDDSTAAGAA